HVAPRRPRQRRRRLLPLPGAANGEGGEHGEREEGGGGGTAEGNHRRRIANRSRWSFYDVRNARDDVSFKGCRSPRSDSPRPRALSTSPPGGNSLRRAG